MVAFCNMKSNSNRVLFAAVAHVEVLVEKGDQAPDHTQKQLVNRFGQLRLAFEIFSRIGGAFAFGLVLDMTTWLLLSCMYHTV